MMRLLVTGGAGFIGSNFISYMLKEHKDIFIVNFDKLTYAANLNSVHLTTFIQGDICDLPLLTKTVKDYEVDHVVNFAAETHVDHSIYGSAEEFVRSNVTGVMSLINLLRGQKTIKRLIHISTDEVYGSLGLADTGKFVETTKFAPSTPYAASKAGGDLLCSSAINTWGLPIIVSHSGNNYGPFQHPEKLIPLCITRIKKGKRLLVHGDGLHIRDWIYVLDHCRAIDLLLRRGVLGQVYNIGVNGQLTNLSVMKLILSKMGVEENAIDLVPDRLGNDRRYAIDYSKIKTLGFKPKYTDFDTWLGKTIDWYNK